MEVMAFDDLTAVKDDMVAFIAGHGMRRMNAFVPEDVSTVLFEEHDVDGWKDFVEHAKAAGASTHGALIEDRSGLALRGITTLAGVIDPGYRGEIRVVVTNLGAAAVEIAAGDRIAQLRLVRRIEARFEEVEELADAPRGEGGFGSTGV